MKRLVQIVRKVKRKSLYNAKNRREKGSPAIFMCPYFLFCPLNAALLRQFLCQSLCQAQRRFPAILSRLSFCCFR